MGLRKIIIIVVSNLLLMSLMVSDAIVKGRKYKAKSNEIREKGWLID